MTDAFTIIAFYYACSTVAETRRISMKQMLTCARSYEMTKQLFLTTDELASLRGGDLEIRKTLNNQAYLRFKEWEAANPEKVERLRGQFLGQSA